MARRYDGFHPTHPAYEADQIHVFDTKSRLDEYDCRLLVERPKTNRTLQDRSREKGCLVKSNLF